MPKRTDIHRILIIGSGPIVIGQACEFDYSGTQACKALREEGYHVVLLNSNPATIMTDPQFADRTYVEPITPEAIEKILRLEADRGEPVDAVLPTLGGQTGLNCAVAADEAGIWTRYGVAMIGADRAAINRAEDRTEFKRTMEAIGVDVPRSGIAHSLDEARAIVDDVGLPCCIRPAYTLGGTGGGFAHTPEEFEFHVRRGLEYSPTREILIEEDLTGWKEYELEVMRDRADNVVIICSIENLDPMGVHTGDSITVAPAQTLTDKEYQRMRDSAIAIIRAIGVETGGSNIQFAVCPTTGRQVAIEMNPRVSRSSALASKATGYPIAKIAAKLAVGYTLDEIPNDITKKTPASFEPTIDYCVVKVPRWTFEKFPEADETLTTQMKSVGEAMAIGRTFKEALQKAIRSMEIKRFGLGLDANDKWLQTVRRRAAVAAVATDPPADGSPARLMGRRNGEAPADTEERSADRWPIPDDVLRDKLARPCQGRLYYIRYALKQGWSVEGVFELSKIDPWFLENIQELVAFEDRLTQCPSLEAADDELLAQARRWGYSDVQLATTWQSTPQEVRRRLESAGPVYKLVDTCAAEFEAETPYYYSANETPMATALATAANPHSACCIPQSMDDEIRVSDRPKIIILGGGPNRIGQGIEFDYCCVHAVMAARELGYETVMINSNPETVSTDYDTADLLFFEPLTHEDVLNICDRLNGVPLGSLPVLDDFTGFRKRPIPAASVHPGVPGLEGIDFALEDAVWSQIEAAVRENDLGPAAVFAAAVGGKGDSEALRVFSVATRSGELWIASFGGGTQPKMLEFREEFPQFLSEVDQAELPRAIERLNQTGKLQGVIVQFGGQTPLNLAQGLQDAGAPIIGTAPESIDLAEDRESFADICRELNLRQPANGVTRSLDEALSIAGRIGYPVLVRPSYVLGGRAMEICNSADELRRYMRTAVAASDRSAGGQEVLIDKFLISATEVDVDCVCDGRRVVVCGVMEHIEEAGVHSGDSACALPPYSLSAALVEQIKHITAHLALRLQVVGLMNVQYAIQDEDIYVLEANPRASRTVPFVSKATGVAWAKVATRCMLGVSLDDQGVFASPPTRHIAVKESVFPFSKFPGVDVILGPEMRSTGEVMGIDEKFALAFGKSQLAASVTLPQPPAAIFLSVNDADKPFIPPIARQLARLGFELVCTRGTGLACQAAGVNVRTIGKISEGSPNALELIEDGRIAMIINTPGRRGRHTDEGKIRAAATLHQLPIYTTITGAKAVAAALAAMRSNAWGVRALQDYHASIG